MIRRWRTRNVATDQDGDENAEEVNVNVDISSCIFVDFFCWILLVRIVHIKFINSDKFDKEILTQGLFYHNFCSNSRNKMNHYFEEKIAKSSK